MLVRGVRAAAQLLPSVIEGPRPFTRRAFSTQPPNAPIEWKVLVLFGSIITSLVVGASKALPNSEPVDTQAVLLFCEFLN